MQYASSWVSICQKMVVIRRMTATRAIFEPRRSLIPRYHLRIFGSCFKKTGFLISPIGRAVQHRPPAVAVVSSAFFSPSGFLSCPGIWPRLAKRRVGMRRDFIVIVGLKKAASRIRRKAPCTAGKLMLGSSFKAEASTLLDNLQQRVTDFK